jgi:hypothetical protein
MLSSVLQSKELKETNNRASNQRLRKSSRELTTLKMITENAMKRHKYQAWGQCPQCLDCFTLELDIFSLSADTDIKSMLSSRDKVRIARRRGSWTIINGNYHLNVRNANVRVRNGNEGWNIYHNSCSEPFRIFSVQIVSSMPKGIVHTTKLR